MLLTELRLPVLLPLTHSLAIFLPLVWSMLTVKSSWSAPVTILKAACGIRLLVLLLTQVLLLEPLSEFHSKRKVKAIPEFILITLIALLTFWVETIALV